MGALWPIALILSVLILAGYHAGTRQREIAAGIKEAETDE